MATLTINQVIPKMTDQNFKKNIKAVGVLSYEIVSAKSIILYGSTKSRADRKQLLVELAENLKSYGAKYMSDSSASGAGVVVIGGTKIMIKPAKVAGGIILKPGFFGTNVNKIVDKDIPFGSYYSAVAAAIRSTEKLDDTQKEVLMALTDDAAGSSSATQSRVKKVMKAVGQTLPLNTINNDFGEVLGPLAIVSRGLLPIQRGSAVVRIPGRSNEPLLDYKITDAKKEYKISAKSGETTNTLKPGDVINLIDSAGKTDKNFYHKKWKKTPQYAVLQILDEGTTKQGPITAGEWLKNNGYKQYFSWLKNTNYTEEVRQRCEDTIVKISREAIDFSEIFSDATTSKVYYVKFRLSLTGDIEWKLVETAQDKKEEKKARKRVTFRSKNFVGRAKDKLGFQV
jgi:hypothetical protein